MAVNPSPIDYQMKAFSKEGEKDVYVPFLNGQAQTPVPLGFAEKPKTASTAQQVLQQEGISSSKQLLQSMEVPKAKDILAGVGVTSASKILEEEGIKQANQKKLQDEMELREKEKEFMKNYKFDANVFNPTEYETKYGDLDFKTAKITNGWGWDELDASYTYQYVIDGKVYHFMPESVATKGVIGKDNKQRYNYAFLNKDTWKARGEYGQAIDLSSMDTTKLTAFKDDPRRTFGEDQMKAMQTTGFLFSESDWNKFRNEHLEGKWKNWGADSANYGTGKNQYGGNIQGISQLKDGSLAYITQPSGGHDQVSTYIASDGRAWLHWYDKPSGFFAEVGKFFNSIPLLPEILVLATGGPASPIAPLYPAIKGTQTIAAGGDLGDVLTSMGTAYVATSPVMKNAIGSLSETMQTSMNISAEAANIASGAVVGAAYRGTIAAMTDQDVNKAMLAGALSGGFSEGTPFIAEKLFGSSEAVASIANATGIPKAQFQNMVVSSMGNAAIGAAVYNKDFFDMFAQDLVTKGLSVSAANKVANNMKANNKDPAEIQKMVRGTQMIVEATARSAIRGTDINFELEIALQRFGESEMLSVAKEVGKK